MFERITYIHGISSSRDLASVTFSQSPVQVIGETVLTKVDESLLINLKDGDVGY